MKAMSRQKVTFLPAAESPTQQQIQQVVALSNAGNLADAAKLARALTLAHPRHGFGWQALGSLLIQQSQAEAALPVIEQAARLLPNDPSVQYNLGLALMNLDRMSEAESHFRQSLLLDPTQASTHNNLGNVLRNQGRLDEAEASFRQAIALKPSHAWALANLGHVLGEQGNLTEAKTAYDQALEIDPTLTEALNSLSLILTTRDDPFAALDPILRSLQIAETPVTKFHFVTIVKRFRFSQCSPLLRNALARALTEPWGQPADIGPTVAHLLKNSPGIGAVVARAVNAWPQRLSGKDLFGTDGFAAVANDPLVKALLVAAPVADVALERFLTTARCVMLDVAIQSDRLAPAAVSPVLGFTSALAQQCFINEYVYAFTDEEAKRATALKDELVAALAANRDIPALWLMAVATYFPLGSLPGAQRLLGCTEPAAVVAVLHQQIREPLEERRLRAAIPCLTPLSEGVSQAVRSMYEENPYPRWVRLAQPGLSWSVDQFMRSSFPLATFRPLGKTSPQTDILIAGCGTGKHSIGVALSCTGGALLAIDLSLASLGYAQRKTLEMGVTGIEYAQADILELGKLDRRFDVIESSGVLHHLADPWAGWRVLLSLLRPGGLMKLGFYSEIARREIVRARALIAERGYGSTPEEIRRCRQDLLALDENKSFGFAVNTVDFFSTSACRDLLFHVQEHRMTLPDIATFLKEHGLRLLGFSLDGAVLSAYRNLFPDDRAATNLANWDVFERENPDTFISMYQFWVQKEGV